MAACASPASPNCPRSCFRAAPRSRSIPRSTPRLYEIAGFKVAGKRAVRVDILERLADIIRPLIALDPEPRQGEPPPGAAEGNGFRVTVEMTSLLGCAGEDFASILTSLGYRVRRTPIAEPAAEPASGPQTAAVRIGSDAGRSATDSMAPPRAGEADAIRGCRRRPQRSAAARWRRARRHASHRNRCCRARTCAGRNRSRRHGGGRRRAAPGGIGRARRTRRAPVRRGLVSRPAGVRTATQPPPRQDARQQQSPAQTAPATSVDGRSAGAARPQRSARSAASLKARTRTDKPPAARKAAAPRQADRSGFALRGSRRAQEHGPQVKRNEPVC